MNYKIFCRILQNENSVFNFNMIFHVLQKLENSTYIDAQATDCWLRDFLDYIDRNKDYSDVDLPISTEYDFANTLRTNYLDPTTATKLDVSFDETNSRVVAARFLIQVRHLIGFLTISFCFSVVLFR